MAYHILEIEKLIRAIAFLTRLSTNYQRNEPQQTIHVTCIHILVKYVMSLHTLLKHTFMGMLMATNLDIHYQVYKK